MREDKYRYGYTDGKNWIFKIFTLSDIENGMPYEEMLDNALLRNYALTSRDRYIGLTDKNGKGIYENDVLKFYYKDGHWFGFGYCFYDIEETQFCHTYIEVFNDKIDFDGQRPSKRFWSNEDILCEIIGNIYENPELLQ